MSGVVASRLNDVSALPVPVADGGTGAATAAVARSNLGLFSDLGWFSNLAIVRATTTNAGDSIKITSANGTALSASNFGLVRLPDITVGQTAEFTVTSDVTILLTGAHWGHGTTGDITGGILRVLAINDNGTLRWGVALLGGRTTLLITDTSATQTSVTLPESVLSTAAVSSASNTCRELGYVQANFDDTGGAAEDLWAIQSGINDCITGRTADGLWQPWNPVFSGFSSDPTGNTAIWKQAGSSITINLFGGVNGTSNAVTFAITGPCKFKRNSQGQSLQLQSDNGTITRGVGHVFTTADSTSLGIAHSTAGISGWTNVGTKFAWFNAELEVGPTASFI